MLPRKFYLDSLFDDFNVDVKDVMKCDVYEKDGVFHIEADVPGFSKDDISVECNEGYLTITAEKNEETTEATEKKFIKKERFYGKTQRKFYIGNVDEEQIQAEFHDGVLKVTVPKEDKERNKKTIDIK